MPIPPSPPYHLGCVSYLNAIPLIAGLQEKHPDLLRISFDVPARLADDLLAGRYDLALCPVADYIHHPNQLRLVSEAGGIACHGPTLTVKVFARKPFTDCRTVAADTDSHTSVNLLRLLWPHHSQHPLALIPTNFNQTPADTLHTDAALLIGDKVITAPPPTDTYPHTLDLGQAWRDRTSLPFVFATWMARPTTNLADLPQHMAAQLAYNLTRLPALAAQAATDKHWPPDLALQYMRDILHYPVGPDDLTAIERFQKDLHQIQPATHINH
ncbi:menaquinone biosynthetic enzyme MqnA/MqnD family protein [Mucisphaera sp.]|uniref:menaquinone biosynthetic enzyme MqnA/MqnD family protein n=1 Tax=Mucisphaera sp. TaxID=2913024 RepID=UPI003D14A6CE